MYVSVLYECFIGHGKLVGVSTALSLSVMSRAAKSNCNSTVSSRGIARDLRPGRVYKCKDWV